MDLSGLFTRGRRLTTEAHYSCCPIKDKLGAAPKTDCCNSTLARHLLIGVEKIKMI